MKKILITAGILGILAMAGCVKDDTVIIRPVITTTVSFQKNVVPLLTKNCAISGCHVSGGQTPNLTADKAYTSLVSGKLVDTGTPANSVLYLHLIGSLSPQMPMGASPNPGNIEAFVLAWVQQGAKNN